MNQYTIIGYYDDTLQRYCGLFPGKDWMEAVQACIASAGPDTTLMIVEVLEGYHRGLTQSNSVESAEDFPMPDSGRPLTAKHLRDLLRAEYEDEIEFGGKTWWREDLAQQFELTPEQLFDRDHDIGLLFELEQNGDVDCHWCERKSGVFDYLVTLKGPRITWD